MQIETLLSRTSAMLTRIAAHAEFTLSDPTIFNTTLTSCLTNPAFSLPDGPVVGLCCSSLLSLQFPDPDPLSADNLMTEFRRFLFAASLVRCGWTGEIPQCDLLAAGHVSGYRLIKRLDRIVSPQFLSMCSRESTQVLFLVVLGAAVSVSPTMPLSRGTPPQTPPGLDKMADDLVRSPTLYLAMKENMCRVVAQHLLLLVSKLGTKLDTGTEQRIFDMATVTWGTMERSVWTETQHGGTGKAELPAQSKRHATTSSGWSGEGHQPWTGSSYHWGMEEPPPSLPTIPGPTSAIRSMSPETTNIGSEPYGNWDANPQSYFDMVLEDELEMYGKPSSTPAGEYDRQRSTTDPLPRRKRSPGESRTRRTIWLVRPFDGGPEKGEINQHTRLRGDIENRNFRMYV